MYAGEHLHNPGARQSRSRGKRSAISRMIPGSTTDRPSTGTAITWRPERLRDNGLASRDSHGGCIGEAIATSVLIERALQYGNYRSVSEHLPANSKESREDVRGQNFVVIQNLVAQEISNLRISVGGSCDEHS